MLQDDEKLGCLTKLCIASQIHWFSIFNSFMMVIFLTGLVSMILMRTLRADYARYTAKEDDDLEALERDVGEESGWGLHLTVCHTIFSILPAAGRTEVQSLCSLIHDVETSICAVRTSDLS